MNKEIKILEGILEMLEFADFTIEEIAKELKVSERKVKEVIDYFKEREDIVLLPNNHYRLGL